MERFQFNVGKRTMTLLTIRCIYRYMYDICIYICICAHFWNPKNLTCHFFFPVGILDVELGGGFEDFRNFSTRLLAT